MELQSFALLLFLPVLITVINAWKRSKQQKLPPGPRKLPFIGNIHNLVGSLPQHALRDLAGKHGPLMHLKLGEVSLVVVSSPPLAEEVLKTKDLAFAHRPELLAGQIVSYNCSDILFSPYGEYWRQMRKICTVELLSRKNVQSFASIRKEEVSLLIESIRSSVGKPFNISHSISSFTSSMLCRTAFGNVCSDRETLVKLMHGVLLLLGSFDIADLFPSYTILHWLTGMRPKLLKLHHKIDLIFEEIINEHMKSRARATRGHHENVEEDLIDVLLRVKENGDLKFPVTNNNIKALIFDMFTGGTETAATVIEWAMSEMMRNPSVMIKAQNEIRRAFEGKKTIEETDVGGLSYLKLVIKETLRLHPPAPLLTPRECREECEVGGYKIPIKTRVFVNAWAIGRDPEYWPNAESFCPERFENSPVDYMGSHFHYIPFGSGRRICPGISYGIANVDYALALLLYHFNWKLPPGIKPDNFDMTETSGITAGRKNHLYLVPELHDPAISF